MNKGPCCFTLHTAIDEDKIRHERRIRTCFLSLETWDLKAMENCRGNIFQIVYWSKIIFMTFQQVNLLNTRRILEHLKISMKNIFDYYFPNYSRRIANKSCPAPEIRILIELLLPLVQQLL